MKVSDGFTERYESLLSLSPAQALAVEVLDAGGSHAEAAQAASVDRTTVSRWATRHPGVVAELNRRRVDRARANEATLSKMDLKALSTIGRAIEAGDVPLSMQWFKIRGFVGLTEVPDGPTDADAVVEARLRGLSSFHQNLADRGEGRTVARTIDVIWSEMEGPTGPGDEVETSWEDLLPDMEPREFADWDSEDFAAFFDELDLDDPEVQAHIQRLGIESHMHGEQ